MRNEPHAYTTRNVGAEPGREAIQDDPDMLKHEIDHLHERMKKRAENLGERLSPNRMVDETVKKVMQDPQGSLDQLVRTVKNHPVASAMVAAGVLSVAGASNKDRITQAYENSTTRRKVDTTAARAKNKAKVMAKSSRETIDSISQSVSENAAELERRAKGAVNSATSSVSRAARRSADASRSMADDARKFAEDNPVALGLFALGVGALAASVFTARRSTGHDAETDLEETAPKVSLAKKATRAKSSPNKTVKKMSPAKKTAGIKKKAATAKSTAARRKAATGTTNAVSRGATRKTVRSTSAKVDSNSTTGTATTGVSGKSNS